MKICKCFKCDSKRNERPLIELPFSTLWHGADITIIGNAEKGEHVCLVCMGYILDNVLEGMGYDLYEVFENMRDNINERIA